jgi:hypothetical protein
VDTKSPFYVVEEFVSPLACEELIDLCNFTVPDTNKDGYEVKTSKTSEAAEMLIYERLQMLMPELQGHYGFKYRGTERVSFEWFPEGSQGQFQSENSEFVRGKWLRTRARDFSAILFLSDYQEQTPFEQEFEVYGGKLEFVQHKFGFNPKRGTLIVFPSDPHFINITTPVFAGDLYQARIHFAAQAPYLYNPAGFPGNYTMWFKPLLGSTG